MYLFRKKVKNFSLTHPLLKLDCSVEPERLIDLTMQLENGGDAKEIILGHMRLAIHIAGQYTNRAPHKADDIVSEAILGLTLACDEIKNGVKLEGPITGYLVSRIHTVCTTFLRKDKIVGMSASTRHRRLKKNQEIIDPKLTQKCPIENLPAPVDTLAETKDLIDSLTKTELEKIVINLRSEDYVDREIAEMINVSLSQVALIRNKVTERYYANLSTI